MDKTVSNFEEVRADELQTGDLVDVGDGRVELIFFYWRDGVEVRFSTKSLDAMIARETKFRRQYRKERRS